jgi:chorismate mutase
LNSESDRVELRKEIQEITLEIVHLAWRRLLLSKKIGKIKNKQGLPIENLEVEKRLKQLVFEACEKYDFDESFLIELVDLLTSQAKRIQLNDSLNN